LTLRKYKLDCLPELPKILEQLDIRHSNIKKLPESILDTKLCHEIYKRPVTKYFHGSFVIHNTPIELTMKLFELIIIKTYLFTNWMTQGHMEKDIPTLDIKKYFQYKAAAKTISNWFLECKFNPKYKFCQSRLDNEFKDLYTE